MFRVGSLVTLLRLGPQRLVAVMRHLPNFLRLFWRLFKDPRVGLGPKLLIWGLLAYLLLPLDLLPDLVPGLGQIDDLIVTFVGLKIFVSLCPRQVVREHVHAIAGR